MLWVFVLLPVAFGQSIWNPAPTMTYTPGPRALHTSTSLPEVCGFVSVIFGGVVIDSNFNFQYLNDTWIFAFQYFRWLTIPSSPLPISRGGHSMLYLDAIRTVMFFGTNKIDVFNDTWVFAINILRTACKEESGDRMWYRANTTCNPDCPRGRWSHVSVRMGNIMYAFGGLTSPWANGYTTGFTIAGNQLWTLTPAAVYGNDTSVEMGTEALQFAWAVLPVAGVIPSPRAGAIAQPFNDESFVMIGG